jgi:hypothetical protein
MKEMKNPEMRFLKARRRIKDEGCKLRRSYKRMIR